MERQTFDYLCEHALSVAIEDVLADIDDEDIQKYHVSYLPRYQDNLDRLYEEYSAYRSSVRERFFDTGEDNSRLMDIHKVCACLMGALLKVRFITYDFVDEKHLNIFYSNYSVALLTVLHVMHLMMLADHVNDQDKSLYEKIRTQQTFRFPKTHPGHDEYLQGRIKALALNDVYGVDFDVLGNADMLFWIEEYNLRLLR